MSILRIKPVIFVFAGLIGQGPILAAEQSGNQDGSTLLNPEEQQSQDVDHFQDRTYSQDVITPEKRMNYMDRMRAAQTQEERDRIREEYHQEVIERAREQGITLPDDPENRGSRRYEK